MKEFRKTEENLLICEECGLLCKSPRGLGPHIIAKHNSKKSTLEFISYPYAL
jgi:hypothetical protein